MRRYYKSLWAFLLVAFLIWGSIRLYFFLTDGFSLGQITPQTYQLQGFRNSPHYSDKEIKKIETILKQPYRYLGKGAQSYAFLSQDGNYVLKFFKQKHLSPSFINQLLFSLPGMESFRLKSDTKYKERWKVLTQSALLAHQYLKEESRLIYVHFAATNDLLPMVTLQDKLGLTYQIDADAYLFYLQEYIFTLRKALDTWDDETSKLGLSRVIDILLLRSSRGIEEDDGFILENMGFIEGEPIFLDIGTLKQRDDLHDPQVYTALLRRDTQPIINYLKKHRPALAEWLENEVERRSAEGL